MCVLLHVLAFVRAFPFVHACLPNIFACLLCAFLTHMQRGRVCAHCADWAGVLAIRKTTSGKVHINHVPQLKERNGAEMGGGRGGGERIMRDCV